MKITVKSIAYHRNGVSGEPFQVVLFDSEGYSNMVAILFPEPFHVAVLNVDQLAKGEIRFWYNSYRGDVFESDLRDAIINWEKSQWSEFERKREVTNDKG